MFVSETSIEEAVEAIINARDFCGNEPEAVREVCVDNGIKDRETRLKVRRIANFRANKVWNDMKRAAGVKEKHLF